MKPFRTMMSEMVAIKKTVFTYNPPCECGLLKVTARGIWESPEALQEACKSGEVVATLYYSDGRVELRGN